MKRVTAIIGTQTKRHTHEAVQEFEKRLKALGDVEFEYVFLSDYNLEFCRGCKLCFDKGEEFCPIKDDRDVLLEKMEQSDGVVFATPNYAFHVSARMKNLLDRIAFVYHRPRYFGRACTAIVAQGQFGGGSIVKYLCTAGENLGFHASKGCVVNTLDPMTDKQRAQLVEKVGKAATRFHEGLNRPAPSPSLMRLVIFRMARKGIGNADPALKDHQYYGEMGWYESDYYYPTSLGPFKRLVGGLAEVIARRMYGVGPKPQGSRSTSA